MLGACIARLLVRVVGAVVAAVALLRLVDTAPVVAVEVTGEAGSHFWVH